MRLASFTLAVVTSSCAAAPPPPLPVSSVRAPELSTAAPSEAVGVAPTNLFPCPAEPRPIARVLERSLDEISGMIESARQPGIFFVHNDSGDSPRFFAIDLAGRLLAVFTLPSVPLLLDAEDISAGPGPDGRRYLYLGDTGNNFSSRWLGIPRRKAVLHRMLEPHVPDGARSAEIPLSETTPIVFTFPEGARDVEAFFVDPVTGDLFLISKHTDGQSRILAASAAELAAGGGELRLVGHLQFGKPPLAGNPMPTAASISADGSRIVVRTYSSVFAFERQADESVAAALKRAPRALTPPDEPQGEAIALTDDGRSFVTISEGEQPRIFCGSWLN